jgi:methyl-accepting chemotaxis protein
MMTLKEIVSGTTNWLRSHRYETIGHCEPVLTSEGLLASHFDASDDVAGTGSAAVASGPVVVSSITSVDRRDSVEKIQDGLNALVGQLQLINGHLNQQLQQHEELMGRVRELPKALESLPEAVQNQKEVSDELLSQLRGNAARNKEFLEVVGQIPEQTARQTDTLTTINHQLMASAEADVQSAESFLKFKGTLEKLNHNTVSNTEGILQMSKTFSTSDRYLKYVISKMNRRYAWTLGIALGVCTAVVCALVGTVLYITR